LRRQEGIAYSNLKLQRVKDENLLKAEIKKETSELTQQIKNATKLQQIVSKGLFFLIECDLI
jgi:hypothetical protein